MKSLNTLGSPCLTLGFTLVMLCVLSPLRSHQSLLQTGVRTYGGVAVQAKGDVFISNDAVASCLLSGLRQPSTLRCTLTLQVGALLRTCWTFRGIEI
jgi:hypothetical protein